MTNIDFYKNSYTFLLSFKPNSLPMMQFEDYLNGSKVKAKTMSDVLDRLCSSLQNYQGMKNYIGYHTRNYDAINRTLFNIDFDKCVKYYQDKDVLYNAFITNGCSMMRSQKSWQRYSKNMINAITWLSQFDGFQDFLNYVNSYTGRELDLAFEIENLDNNFFGFALACDFFKELGFYGFSKPDTHIIKVLNRKYNKDNGINSNIEMLNKYGCFIELKKIAKDNNITDYHLDKLIWTICSGEFHAPLSIKFGSKRDEYLKLIAQW